MILKCSCKNEYQDKYYGKNMRVFNMMHKADSEANQKYRCSVCGKERIK